MVEILEELDPDPTKLKNRSLALKKTGHDPALTQPDLNKSTRIGIGTPQDKAKANLSVQFCPGGHTECPKIYRKSVLHLLNYGFAVSLCRCIKNFGKFWDTQYIHVLTYHLI